MTNKRSNSITQESAPKKARTQSTSSEDNKFSDAQESATVEVNDEAIIEEETEAKESNIDSALIAQTEEKETAEATPVNGETFIEEPYAAAAAEQSKQSSVAAAAAAAAASSAVVANDEAHPTQEVPTDLVPSASIETAPTAEKSEKPAKPEKDSEEYHRLRKESHKEVERRRRENINAGIRELSALLPSTETHKHLILTKAAEYIKRLKENETNNTEKWTLEKLLKEQTNNELSASNEKLKIELERAYREIEHWKNISQSK